MIFEISTFMRLLIVIFLYFLHYYCLDASCKGVYKDRKSDEEHEYANLYYVPEKPWRANKFYSFFLHKTNAWHRYPDSEYGANYYSYREMQVTVIARLLAFPSALFDAVLFLMKTDFAGICILACVILSTTLEIILTQPIMKCDVKRLKSYRYTVAGKNECIVSEARGKLPKLWKINTLLDVFFFFGQAPVRCCEPQNYLVYRLKDGKLLYVFLKDCFDTMPEEDLSPYEGLSNKKVFWHYNPAMGVWVDACICVDENRESAVLSGRHILPQDMPESIN